MSVSKVPMMKTSIYESSQRTPYSHYTTTTFEKVSPTNPSTSAICSNKELRAETPGKYAAEPTIWTLMVPILMNTRSQTEKEAVFQ